jgi:hypothetical protein
MSETAIISWSWLRRLVGRPAPTVEIMRRRSAGDWGDDSRWFSNSQPDRPSAELSLADIPTELKRRLQQEAVQATFHRLEMPLRFLLYATASGREPGSLSECQEILHLWRQGLEQEARLIPDGFSGAIRNYDPAMESVYSVKGRCTTGQQVRITVPAWRLHGEVIVRGEAEPYEGTRPPEPEPGLPPRLEAGGPQRGPEPGPG